MTYLAVPIANDTTDEMVKNAEQAAQAGAELVELRCDYLTDLRPQTVAELIKKVKINCDLPMIVTCRDKAEGGKGDWSTALRIEILKTALWSGADYIDCEYENFANDEIRKSLLTELTNYPPTRLIVSAHNFQGPFVDVESLYKTIKSMADDVIPKIVYKANHINDCFEALDLLHKTEGEDRIILCMGKAGKIVRILAEKFGAFVTFAAVDSENTTADGQLTIEEFTQLYRFGDIDENTELFGVIGSPIEHSMSPAIHNACFKADKQNKLYLSLLVDPNEAVFDMFMRGILGRQWIGFKGFSVTLPHKQNALKFAKREKDVVEEITYKIGAANTIIVAEERTVKLYNTDWSGAMKAVCVTLKCEPSDLAGIVAAVAGAGGVARAIVAGLTEAGCDVTVYNRTVEKAEKLAEEFGCESLPLDKLNKSKATLLVNCTSIGMSPNIKKSIINKKYLSSDMVVFDTVYNPPKTKLLKDAEDAGAKIVSGVDMFVNQAALQYKLFTGIDANEEVMRNILSDL